MCSTTQVRSAGIGRHALLAALIAAASHAPPGYTQERERCYPGPPVYILRELLGGDYTPERYRAAILDYARAKCSNGQTLKLVSPAGPGAEDKLNGEVALELCDQETIYRDRLAAGEKALVLFCLVSKLDPPSR
jgi:hypothetical protein